jgi:hypothetical protein
VLNANSPPSPRYLILHRATCFTISGSPPAGENWTVGMSKFCAEHKAELKGFARVVVGGEATPCGTCNPER